MKTKPSPPTDDSPASIKARMDAVYNGHFPKMPKLSKMTKKQMARELQSIWTLCDETGVHRRNKTSPQHHLGIYGRVYAAIKYATICNPGAINE